MSFEFYQERVYIAKKDHFCEICGKKIESGSKYTYCSGKIDGDFYYIHNHSNCLAVYNFIRQEANYEELCFNETKQACSDNEYNFEELLIKYKED
jgi:hypothetical protein